MGYGPGIGGGGGGDGGGGSSGDSDGITSVQNVSASASAVARTHWTLEWSFSGGQTLRLRQVTALGATGRGGVGRGHAEK